MSQEYDDETLRLLASYGGRDPRVPHEVQIDALYEFDGEWSLAEFRDLVDRTIESIPPGNRDSARVELSSGECGRLKITYTRMQNADEVAQCVIDHLQYAKRRQDVERAEYERLRGKFEGR